MREIIPLTTEILVRFHGKLPPYSVIGIAAVKDGMVVGVGGYYRVDTRYILFSRITDELRADKRLLVMALRKLADIRMSFNLPVQSIGDKSIPGYEVLLRHVGFRQDTAMEDVWHG